MVASRNEIIMSLFYNKFSLTQLWQRQPSLEPKVGPQPPRTCMTINVPTGFDIVYDKEMRLWARELERQLTEVIVKVDVDSMNEK